MFCGKCGTESANGEKFCKNCGNQLEQPEQQTEASQEQASQQNPVVQQAPVNQQPVYGQQAPYGQGGTQYQQPFGGNGMPVNENMIPEEYRPISMWGYFGYQLLFAIPCIGFIMLLVFSFGGTKNKNLRNFARSYFCLFIIGIVIALLIVAAVGIGAVGAYSRYY